MESFDFYNTLFRCTLALFELDSSRHFLCSFLGASFCWTMSDPICSRWHYLRLCTLIDSLMWEDVTYTTWPFWHHKVFILKFYPVHNLTRSPFIIGSKVCHLCKRVTHVILSHLFKITNQTIIVHFNLTSILLMSLLNLRSKISFLK